MIRGIIYWIFGTIFTVLVTFFFYLMYPFSRLNPDLPHLIVKFWSKGLLNFFCGTGIEVSGWENIDLSRNYIIVSNHRSHTDILLATAAVGLQFRWFSKSSLFKIPAFGMAMKIAGYVPVERGKYMSASRSLDNVKKVLEEGKSVWIFPEGTRTPKDKLGKFKRGAFLLAKETGKPILPVILAHTDEIFYRTHIIRRKTVKVIICKPVFYKDFKDGTLGERDVMLKMIQLVSGLIQDKFDNEY
ncbi:MAG TPA: 1-acyl-sn-glycerol-3-phosphate acyltransferase [Spirochaetes bacterium]|nr:1-acyl-sn-glycerol-3-phosphate acyltransferase [Spirochaetota bacterium]